MRKPADPINSPYIFEPTRDELEQFIGLDPHLDPGWELQLQLGPLPEGPEVRELQERGAALLGHAKTDREKTCKEVSQFVTELLWLDKVIRDAHDTRNKLLSNLSYDAREILTKEWVHFEKDNELYQLQGEDLVVSRRTQLEKVEPVRIQEELYDLNPPGDAPQEYDKPEPPVDHPAVQTRDQHPGTVEMKAVDPNAPKRRVCDRGKIMQMLHFEVCNLFGWLDYDTHKLCRGLSGLDSLKKATTTDLHDLYYTIVGECKNEYGDNITQQLADDDVELAHDVHLMESMEQKKHLSSFWLEQVAPYWGKLRIVPRAVLYVRYQQKLEALTSGRAA